MFSAILGVIKGFFGNGGIGGAVGNGVANVAAIAAIAPAVIWLITNWEGVAITLTWGQLAVAGLVAVFVLKIVHYSRPGSPNDRSEWKG